MIRERVLGVAVRTSAVVIALKRKVLAYGFTVGSTGEAVGDTFDAGIAQDGRPKGKGKAQRASASAGATGSGFAINKIGEWETAENIGGTSSSITVENHFSSCLALNPHVFRE